ncbi:hypothetical protein F750_2959 [Streptomyces sp. PAMC 26508]|nr:hypothetical protein F750_2959 [Streptomyces sp. PAMC 26508]
MHDLPGIGRVRWRGLLPEPTCRHGGCPLLRLVLRTAYAVAQHGPPAPAPPSPNVTGA